MLMQVNRKYGEWWIVSRSASVRDMTPAASPLTSILAAVMMIAVFALTWGGIHLLRRSRADRIKGVLMLVCAAVILGNVLIWTV
jgi:hypothetical protein